MIREFNKPNREEDSRGQSSTEDRVSHHRPPALGAIQLLNSPIEDFLCGHRAIYPLRSVLLDNPAKLEWHVASDDGAGVPIEPILARYPQGISVAEEEDKDVADGKEVVASEFPLVRLGRGGRTPG